MGCGASSRSVKTHPEQQLSPESVVPDSPKSPTKELLPANQQTDCTSASTADAEQIDASPQGEEDFEDDDDEGEDDDDDSDESVPGEPMEAKWARAAKKKKKLARQRKRAAKKAALEGAAISAKEACADRFKGVRRPRANPQKEGCFDRQCFLAASCRAVDEIYDLSVNLGKGTFGTVERCTHRKTQQVQAMKTIAKKKVYNPDRMAQEVEIMRILEHPHILKMYETFEDEKYIYIVMELCKGGELLDKLLDLTSGGFSEKAVAKVMRQVVSAVNYMHQQNVAHRDLKPENFLLAEEVDDIADAHIKVIDFGFSTLFQPGVPMSTRAVTTNYVAPEVLDGSYTEICDMWSIGVIIYVLLSGQKPFFGACEADVMAKIKRAEYTFDEPSWETTSEDAKQLIRGLILLNPAERLTAAQVLQHKWMGERFSGEAAPSVSPEVLSRLHSFSSLGKFKKALMTAVAQQLPEDAIRKLRKAFQALDADEDGVLSLEELKNGLARCGLEHSADLGRIFASIDSDGSQQVDYSEFLAAAIDEKNHLVDSACWSAFRIFDINGDGKITKDEMALMLSCGQCQSLTDLVGADKSDIEQAVVEADLDGDQRLDFEEFKALLQSCARRSHVEATLPSAIPS